MTDPLGQSQVLPYIAGLSELGYSFTLISCEKPDRFKQFSKKINEYCSTHGIVWKPLPYHKKPPVLSTLYDYFRLRRSALEIYKSREISLVHCRSYIPSLIGNELKVKKGIKFVFDMRGFWADERVDGGLWNISNPVYRWVYRFFKRQERQFIQHADSIVSLTEAGRSEIQNWDSWKQNKNEITVVPCSADFEHFQLLNDAQKYSNRVAMGIGKDQFVLSYLGSLGTWYLLDEMLLFFRSIKSQKQTALFLIVTPESPDIVYEKARKLGISKESIHVCFKTRQDLVDTLSVSDLSISFIKPAYSKISSSPTKLGELLAMGIPVICNSGVGDVKEIVEKIDGGIVLDSLDTESFDKIVTNLDSLNTLNRQTIREKAMEYYSLTKAVNKYADVYKSILGQ